MPTKFKDCAKKANDLLDRGFDATNSVKVSTKSATGVAYNAELKEKKTDGVSKISSKVGAKFKHSSGINFKKFEVANNGKLTADVLLENAVDNTTFTLGVVMQPADLATFGEKCEVGVEYSHEKAFFTLGVSPLLPTAANASLVIKAHDNVCVGGSYQGQLDDTWVTTAGNACLCYCDGSGTKVSLASSDFFKKFTLSAHRQHSADIALATKVGLSRENPSEVSVTVGGSYQYDANLATKAKITVPKGSADGATAALGFNHKLNDSVRLTGATTIQLNPQDDLFGASFAVGLEFGSV